MTAINGIAQAHRWSSARRRVRRVVVGAALSLALVAVDAPLPASALALPSAAGTCVSDPTTGTVLTATFQPPLTGTLTMTTVTITGRGLCPTDAGIDTVLISLGVVGEMSCAGGEASGQGSAAFGDPAVPDGSGLTTLELDAADMIVVNLDSGTFAGTGTWVWADAGATTMCAEASAGGSGLGSVTLAGNMTFESS